MNTMHASSSPQVALGAVGRVWLWLIGALLIIAVLPMGLGWTGHVVMSGSMVPRVMPGDIVVTSPLPDTLDGPQLVGKVVVIERPAAKPVVHRVVRRLPDGTYVTQGDANPQPDTTPATFDQITGLGRLRVPYIAAPIRDLQQGRPLTLLLFIASIVLAAWFVARDRPDDEPHPDQPEPDTDPDDARAEPEPDDRDERSRRQLVGAATSTIVAVGVMAAVCSVPVVNAAFSAATDSIANSWQASSGTFTDAILQRTPSIYWKFGEASGNSAADTSGNARPGRYSPNGNATNFTVLTDGPLTAAGNRARRLVRTQACVVSDAVVPAIAAPQILTLASWIRTPAGYTTGGTIATFDVRRTGTGNGTAGDHDRTLFMDGTGLVRAAVYTTGGYRTVTTPTALNDGAWHLVVMTLSSAGTSLYVDGVVVATDAAATSAAPTTGWWRAGCGNLAGLASAWSGANPPNADPTRNSAKTFTADLDEVAVWNGRALTAGDVAALWAAR